MTTERVKVSEKKLNINFIFYLFLKELNGRYALTSSECDEIVDSYKDFTKNFKNYLAILRDIIKSYKNSEKRDVYLRLVKRINTVDILELFIFAVRLIQIKPVLLDVVKMDGIVNKKQNINHPLSLKYDICSREIPYHSRVNGALFVKCVFDKLEKGKRFFLSEKTTNYISDLMSKITNLEKRGVEPNQIFMLIFTESVNQSVISEAGNSYEKRIRRSLLSVGIDEDSITKTHDKADKSMEFDFFFELNGKTFGISAKRTLRERYKQFIKTSQTSQIDVLIEITLGIDLTEEKARTIRKHGVYIIVADEVYDSNCYLQKIDGIYKGSCLTKELLLKLSRNAKKVGK